MTLSALVLIVGASVSSEWNGVPSAARRYAEMTGAPYEIHAAAGATLDKVMPSDEKVRAAAVFVSMDGLYWYNGLKSSVDTARATLDHLLAVRGDKPVILATVPWDSRNARAMNALLEEQAAKHPNLRLIRLEGDLEPKALHPDAEYHDKVLRSLYAEQ